MYCNKQLGQRAMGKAVKMSQKFTPMFLMFLIAADRNKKVSYRTPIARQRSRHKNILARVRDTVDL